jgi:hypothetical protein
MDGLTIVLDMTEFSISINGEKVFMSPEYSAMKREVVRRANINWAEWKDRLPKTWRDV